MWRREVVDAAEVAADVAKLIDAGIRPLPDLTLFITIFTQHSLKEVRAVIDRFQTVRAPQTLHHHVQRRAMAGNR